MSWGIELWDQYDNITKHTEKGIEFCEFYSNFVKQRSDCELAYAKSLRKLLKNFTPKKKNEDSEFSANVGFHRLLTEVGDLAGQHESIAEKLADEVAKSVVALAAELRQERKKHMADGDNHSKNLQLSLDQLDKTKKTYEKAFKQSCTAIENFHKADADLNLSRAEVERSKNVMHNKKTICDECKSAYAKQLESTNSVQRDHYTKNIPSVFQAMQEMDERRISRLADCMRNSAELHQKVLPIIQKCLDGMITASNEIDPVKDSQIVIGRYKSGFNHPGDIPFEDLNNFNSSNSSLTGNNNGTNPGSHNSLSSASSHESSALQPSPNKLNTIGKSGTIGNKKRSKPRVMDFFHKDKNTLSASSIRKPYVLKAVSSFASQFKGEESEDFRYLPPTQRQKRLQTKIDALNSQIKKEAEERDAMTRMSELYTKNPSLGDAAPLAHRLAENQKVLDSLQTELKKYQGFLHEVEAQLTQLSGSNQDLSPKMGGAGPEFRHSTSDLSMASNSTGGAESGHAGSGGASSTHSGNTDPGEAESSAPSTPQPPHHLNAVPVASLTTPLTTTSAQSSFVAIPSTATSSFMLPPSIPSLSSSSSMASSSATSTSRDAFWDSPLQFMTEQQHQQLQQQQQNQQTLSHHNLQRHQNGTNGSSSHGSLRSNGGRGPLPVPPRGSETQLSVETPMAQKLQQHLAANEMEKRSVPHRMAPLPPVETEPDRLPTLSEAHVDAGDSVSDAAETVSGAGSAAEFLPPTGEEEGVPEPPSYPPPPPPPDDDDIEFGSAQDIDQSSSYSPESGYIGDAGYQDEDLPVICRCRALYSFQADNAGTISMLEGEELEVVEEDQGDGWTRVRRPPPRGESDDGFVPTSYLELNV